MADSLGDRRERHTGLHQVGDVAVPQVVEADLWQASRLAFWNRCVNISGTSGDPSSCANTSPRSA
jgi:hypothetical protein